MGKSDARARYLEAVNTFRQADETARADWNKVDERAFRMMIIDMDAAIPGLEGTDRGRALLFKAAAQLWISLGRIALYGSEITLIDDPRAKSELDALRKEGLSWALLGREIVKEHGVQSDLVWADDLVNKLQSGG